MKNKFRRYVAGLALVLVISITGNCWSDSGHMAVAFVAYQRLTPEVRARVDQLIKFNPRFVIWNSNLPLGTPASKRSLMLFMMAATWADQIKGDPQYFRDDIAKNVDDITGYIDRKMHQSWHFVDQPFTLDGSPTKPPTTPNLQTQIAALRQAIASNNANETKSYALVWLIHLVGDAHQPLHTSSRFSQSQLRSGHRDGDFGGNLVSICDPQCGRNLHSMWDSLLGTKSDPQTIISIAQTLPAPPPKLAAIIDLASWLKEDLALATRDVYIGPIGPAEGPYKITPQYRENARKIAMQRIALAGARLANILNSELK